MLFFVLIACLSVASGYPFETIYKWQQIEFDFPNVTVRNAYESHGRYVPGHTMPLGLQTWQNKMFITVPRWKSGVPSNLNYFWMNDTSTSPVLMPYPDWETNDIHSSDGIVSIFRVRVDACDRLWGLDTGMEDILGENIIVNPMRLVVIDLKTDKVLRIYQLKDTDQKADSFIGELVVDVEPNNCDDAYVYMSDLGGYGLVVYSWAKNESWRIQHNYFHFDPLNGDYDVNGIKFQWTDGVFGMSLTPIQEDGYRTLYFHAMSGITEFSVSTKVLRDQLQSVTTDYYAFHVVGDKGPRTQGPTSIVDEKTGVNYFTQVNRNGVACWDTSVKLDPSTFVLVAQDNETLVFPNDMNIDVASNRLMVLSDNLPKLEYSEYDLSKPNFFISAAPLDALTPLCKRQSVV